MRELERKIALLSRLRTLAWVLMLPFGLVAFWAGIKHAAKAQVVDGGTLLLVWLVPVGLWLLSEYFSLLKGKYTRQLLERQGQRAP